MTMTFGVNENNDIFINSSGNLDIQTGIEATLQACAQISKAQLGEMIYEAEAGIPNFQVVWVGVPNLSQFEAYLRTALLSVEGVSNILNLTTNISNNVLSYTAVIQTIYGQGTLNETVSISGGNGVLIGMDGEDVIGMDGNPVLTE